MVSEVRDWLSRHQNMVSKVVNNFADDKLDLYFIRNWYHVFKGFHCVILDLEDGQFLICSRNSDFQWLQELLFGFFRNTDISHKLALFSSLSSSRGENTWKYKAIHEIAVNLDNLSSFSWVILVWGTQATQATDTQATLTHHTKRQRKFELFNPSQASLRSSPGKVQQCSLILWLHNTTSCTCAAEQRHRVAAGRSTHHMQRGSWAASLWHADHITQQTKTSSLTSVICQIIC